MDLIREQIINVDPATSLQSTLLEMKRLEILAVNNSKFVDFVYQKFYTENEEGMPCVVCYPGKIWEYMKNNFYYIQDEYDETIAAPYLMPRLKKGDCDDFALFAKTCLDILGGWNTNYLLLGKTTDGFSHVAVFANRGKSIFRYIDPVVIDGANSQFNVIDNKYIYRSLVK